MRHISISPISALLALAAFTSLTTCSVVPPQQLLDTSSLTLSGERDANISIQLFAELEELARIVDISYCVDTTGITNPFVCASRCDEFPNFELVTTFNTGPLMSDSCGYVVLDHGTRQDGHSGEWKQGQSKKPGRIIVAFRGTYSITNTIVDLSTVPQEYIPYPEEPGNSTAGVPPEEEKRNHRFWDWIPRPGFLTMRRRAAYQEVKLRARCAEHRAKVEAKRLEEPERKCQNCTVHTGFWTSWQNTRSVILPHLIFMKHKYPDYELHLVGHSLGGAVAALAGLEFQGADWEPIITTFGEPRVGNAALRDYIDSVFCLSGAWNDGRGERYRRVTHVDDPVPLLPLQEWGYRAHAGEVYISKPSLSPSPSDLRICFGDEDVNCIASAEIDQSWFDIADLDMEGKTLDLINQPARDDMQLENRERRWGVRIPARYKIWQLFFAHRDYFWRLGVCFPGGDPLDWGKPRYNFTDLEIKASEVKVEL